SRDKRLPQAAAGAEGNGPRRESLPQVLSLEELAHDVEDPVLHPHVVDSHDVGVVQRSGEARLLLEPGELLRVRGELGADDLEGDVAMQTLVPCPVDLAHAAGADETTDLVGPRRGAGGGGQVTSGGGGG